MNLVCSVVRGEVLRRIDDSLNTEDIDDSLKRLKAAPLFQVADDRGGLRAEEVGHAKDHLFNKENSGWWPDDDGVAETGAEREMIMRAGYIQALERRKTLLAQGIDKKIHSLWLRGMKDRVETYVFELGSEIVVQWLTPDVPADPNKKFPPPGDKVAPIMHEQIWAVATSERIDAYVKKFDDATGYTTNDTNRVKSWDELDGVKIFHVIGY